MPCVLRCAATDEPGALAGGGQAPRSGRRRSRQLRSAALRRSPGIRKQDGQPSNRNGPGFGSSPVPQVPPGLVVPEKPPCRRADLKLELASRYPRRAGMRQRGRRETSANHSRTIRYARGTFCREQDEERKLPCFFCAKLSMKRTICPQIYPQYVSLGALRDRLPAFRAFSKAHEVKRAPARS